MDNHVIPVWEVVVLFFGFLGAAIGIVRYLLANHQKINPICENERLTIKEQITNLLKSIESHFTKIENMAGNINAKIDALTDKFEEQQTQLTENRMNIANMKEFLRMPSFSGSHQTRKTHNE